MGERLDLLQGQAEALFGKLPFLLRLLLRFFRALRTAAEQRLLDEVAKPELTPLPDICPARAEAGPEAPTLPPSEAIARKRTRCVRQRPIVRAVAQVGAAIAIVRVSAIFTDVLLLSDAERGAENFSKFSNWALLNAKTHVYFVTLS